MRFWISRKSDVPVREQLATQILLAINSKELRPEQKLPSTRSLARRLGIHANTINAAYRDLAKRGWLEFRPGSGVYVRTLTGEQAVEGELELDQLISKLIQTARSKGFTLAAIRARIKHWLELQPPDHFLVIEDDPELRRILEHEVREFTGVRVAGLALADCGDTSAFVGAAPVALFGKADVVGEALPPDCDCAWLEAASVQDEIQKWFQPMPDDGLLVVASIWPDFLRWARTVLVATGLDRGSLSFQDSRRKGWEESLRLATFVVTDSVTKRQLPAKYASRSVVFSVLAESALEELKRYADEFH